MMPIKEYPNQYETKAFNKGWGRSLACAFHFFREHLMVELTDEDQEQFIRYMEKNRRRQFKKPKGASRAW